MPEMNPLTLAAAYLIDVVVGDPQRLPHPVRAIGWLINVLERWTRRLMPRRERAAGFITVLGALAMTFLVVGGSCTLATRLDPRAGLAISILWLASGFATRSLSDHARQVSRDLHRGDLPAARRSVGHIVGRDTDTLDCREISRATVESVAESTVDGVVSPLFFAVLGGPVGLWIFKAVSTCDSMIGHKDERYIRFGTFGARLDDALNYIPARLAFLLFPLAAWIAHADPRKAWHVAKRDHTRHASPNSGIPEAAIAGALNVRLGGPATYEGIPFSNPVFGAEFREAEPADIPRAIRMLWIVSLLALLAGLAALHAMRFISLSQRPLT